MGKDRVLRRIVLLQAVCMIVLTVVVVAQVFRPGGNENGDREEDSADSPSEASQQIAATIGGESITTKELMEQLREQYGDTVLQALLSSAAVRMEAEALGLQVTPEELDHELQSMMAGYEDEEHYYAQMKEALGLSPEAIRRDTEHKLLLEKITIHDVQVSDEEINAYIEANQVLFEPAVSYRLAWIVTGSEEEADEVLDQLAQGADFAELARAYSIDSDTADSGGVLGLIDQYDPYFEQEVLAAAAELHFGEITGPIPALDGQAVIKLIERIESTPMSEALIRETARKEVALSKAESLRDVEERLLTKYEAHVRVSPGTP
ncbi:foldase protein PrsA [Paenibacillus phyllosphaerae]|uniref:peptidylprolyl isomerase n=1 Tax=Paenibacillus phyllosphaerae TaxID=274593 RepID=A0A7W5B5R3_9BACL|nr:peptidylprolyl isomerase [Paenibacillus phyllosphaerae]MBB3114141.1 foldase protein PrsA [Paenibacillus phyllosphaerae]